MLHNALCTFVNDHFLQPAFAVGPLHDPLIERIGSHQSVDHDRLRLSDPMTPVLSLQVRLRVLTDRERETTGHRIRTTQYQDDLKSYSALHMNTSFRHVVGEHIEAFGRLIHDFCRISDKTLTSEIG